MMDPMLNIAIKAARIASKPMLHNIERLDQLEIEKKLREISPFGRQELNAYKKTDLKI